MNDKPKKTEVKPVVLESGIEVQPSYGPEDVDASGGFDRIGKPGEYPFTRGIHQLMYRKRPWTMRQYSGFGTAADTNERFKYLIAQGNTGLNVAFDLPTQIGLDSDDPMAEGEVGRVGMAVDTLADFEEAFDGIDLDEITVSLTINGAAITIMSMYFALAEKRGYDLKNLRGTAQNDILKEYIGRGTWIFPVGPSVKMIGDTIVFCAENLPKYSPISVCGYHIRESGADPVQEIAYGFAIATAYIDHVLQRGLDIDQFAPRFSFNFDIHGNFFEQIAKFRAARRLWAEIIKERYGAMDPRSMLLRMIAGGGGGGLTIEQPENNIVRGAYYALISALSGTQTMALCSYDEAYTIPTEKAARISLRTMQILQEEMGLCDTVDPLAGSYYVETLTNQIEKRIVDAMARVDRMGGIVKAIEEGMVQSEVSRNAFLREKGIQEGTIRKVGVNCFQVEEEERDVELHPYKPEEAARQIERLNQVRSTRDSAAVKQSLRDVKRAAADNHNLVPPIIAAVKAMATVGEVTAALKEVYGSYEEPIRF
jgi:methylmalonyl-CoA mutase N-terminal domain/subunit